MAPLGMRLALCALGMAAAQDLFIKDSANGKFLAQKQPPPPWTPVNSTGPVGPKPRQPAPPRPGPNGTMLRSSNSWYKTIGPSDANGALCLDLPGGDVTAGTLLWLWSCDGQDSATWVFDNYQIKYGLDDSLCVDAREMENGEQLMLWPCNEYPQQTWGWDDQAARIYINGRSTCFDWYDKDYTLGQPAHIWECNGLDNQWFSLWDAPTPGGGGGGVFPSDHCAYDVGGWPSFQTQQELQNDPWWSAYFINVYGAVPGWGYPICPGAFQFLWQNAANQAGVVTNTFTECAPGTKHGAGQELPDGTYYIGNSFMEARDVYGFIYNSKLLGAEAPANVWTEVTHTQFPGDVGAIWYYMSIGSGVWIYTGNTWAFDDHSTAMQNVLGQSCSDGSQNKHGPPATECENNFDDLYLSARSQSVDTIQFTNHHDCTCGPKGPSSYKYNRQCMTEIIALGDPNGASSGCSNLLRGGWEASEKCNCQTSFTSTTKGGDLCDANGQNNCQYANCGIW